LFLGHYCPNGTEYDTKYPCSPGTYNQNTKGRSPTDCLDCPGGKYCDGSGNTAPDGNCTSGWYCSGGAESPNDTAHGGKCQPGYYCPEGKSCNLKLSYGEKYDIANLFCKKYNFGFVFSI